MRRGHYEKLALTLVGILITVGFVVILAGFRIEIVLASILLARVAKKWLFEIWDRQRDDVNRGEAIKLTVSIEEASVRDHTKSRLALVLAENPEHRSIELQLPRE